MRKNKKKDNEGGGAPDWMVSYGDVMSLLLTFFVLLFSFSTIDAQKWQELVDSFNGEVSVFENEQDNEAAIINLTDYKMGADKRYNNEIQTPGHEEDKAVVTEEPEEKPEEDTSEEKDEFVELFEKIQGIAEKNNYDAKAQVILANDMIILRFDNQLLFDSGKATLDIKALDVLVDICPVINEHRGAIGKLLIEGNTDNVPIKNLEYRDNYELSTQRALVVLYYLRDEVGFPKEKLVAVGYGEFNPIADNLTEDGRSQNRRTDIVLLKAVKDMEEKDDTQDEDEPGGNVDYKDIKEIHQEHDANEM